MIILETSYGPISIELDYKNTPETAKNFEQYVKDGFYDGVIFHRVIDNFMIQGGGFLPGMEHKQAGKPIANEANRCLPNKRGTIAMARTHDPHSASSQFFINVKDNGFLDFTSESVDGWGYCTFGQVVDGMSVIDEIKSVETESRFGHQDVPVDDVVIKRAYVSEESA